MAATPNAVKGRLIVPNPIGARANNEASSSYSTRAQRASVMLIAVVEQLGGKTATKHRVRDISSGGIRIDNADSLQPGETVSVSVGALQTLGATVKWVRKGFAGLAFAELISPEDARKKALIASGPLATPGKANAHDAAPAPSAGWLTEMRNRYRT